MGAAIVTKQLPRDAWEDAVVGYGGPALGSLGAAGVAVAAHLTDSQLLYALADFGFMINLFNLLPIGSMDGGRICTYECDGRRRTTMTKRRRRLLPIHVLLTLFVIRQAVRLVPTLELPA